MASKPQRSAASDLLVDDPRVKAIANLFGKPEKTLADYHKIGRKLGELAADPAVTAGGAGWKKRVEELAGPSEATQSKCLRFRNAYDDPDDFAELEKLGVTWAKLTISLGVEDREQRHRLLRAAIEGNWSDRELQKKIQQDYGRRRGGGRPQRAHRSLGLQADSSRLLELLKSVDTYLNDVWLKNRARYREEADGLEGEARDTTRRILERARQTLSEVIGGLELVTKDLEAYRRRIPGDGTGQSDKMGTR